MENARMKFTSGESGRTNDTEATIRRKDGATVTFLTQIDYFLKKCEPSNFIYKTKFLHKFLIVEFGRKSLL